MNPRAALVAAVLLVGTLPGEAPAFSTFVQTQIQLNTPFADPFSAMPINTNGGPSSVTDALSVPFGEATCPGGQTCTQGVDGSVSAFANQGLLGAAAAGNATAGNTGAASFFVDSQALWIDSITIASGALAPGTPVNGVAILAFEGTTSFDLTSTGGVAVAGGEAQFQSGLFMDGQPLGVLCADTLASSGCDALPEGVPFASRIVIPIALTVGQTFTLEGTLHVTASGSATTAVGALATVGVNADGAHTAQAYLQPLGDFSFVAESGHDYAAPVPEPDSLALLGIALVGLRTRAARVAER